MSMNQDILSDYVEAEKLLDEILAIPIAKDDTKDFTDKDGLISFVGLSSEHIIDMPEYKIGRDVCDKVANFYCTLRDKTFIFLQKNPSKVPPGDSVPVTKWDPAVSDYMDALLQKAGGFANYKRINTDYSYTQYLHEFSTKFIQILFDAATTPSAIITPVVDFLKGVGDSLRSSWDQKERHYKIAVLSQCHESILLGSSETAIYYPKVKYYYIEVNARQTEFTTPCSNSKKITFNFQYANFTTGLKNSILDKNTEDYKNFVKFLNKAQAISYKEADNDLEAILDVNSDDPDVLMLLKEQGVDILSYPLIRN
ncbi:hypothetical protein [Photorhabdus laumondii]